MPYGQQPLDQDEEVRKRKAAENPLVQYFGASGSAAPTPAPKVAPTAAPQAAPAAAAPHPATNVGTNAAPPAQPQQRAPAPTNFTNFSRVQSANRDVSNREAAAYGQRATDSATKARSSLDALKQHFGEGVTAGTVAGPGEADQAQYDPDNPNADSSGIVMGASSADYAKAQSGYTGPGSLGDIAGVDDTYASTLAAQQGLDALGSQGGMQALIQKQNQQGSQGTSAYSANLIGAAGRKDFDSLRGHFNPDADMTAAEKAAADQAAAAGATSDANAGAWQQLGDKAKGREDATAAQIAASQAKDAQSGAQSDRDKQAMADFDATDKGDARLGAKTAFEYLDPLNYVSGGKRDFAMNWLGNTFGEDYKGNISWEDNPMDRDVYSQMDAPQWEELSQLTGVAQRNWINQRAAELKNGTGRARGTYQSHLPTNGGK